MRKIRRSNSSKNALLKFNANLTEAPTSRVYVLERKELRSGAAVLLRGTPCISIRKAKKRDLFSFAAPHPGKGREFIIGRHGSAAGRVCIRDASIIVFDSSLTGAQIRASIGGRSERR